MRVPASFFIVTLSTWDTRSNATPHSLPTFKVSWQLVQKSGLSLIANPNLPFICTQNSWVPNACEQVCVCACVFICACVCHSYLKITPVVPHIQTHYPPHSLSAYLISTFAQIFLRGHAAPAAQWAHQPKNLSILPGSPQQCKESRAQESSGSQ